MTIDEAIYCMKSYLPNSGHEHCENCPYYMAQKLDEQVSVCNSSKAHEMAIKALEEYGNNHFVFNETIPRKESDSENEKQQH